MSFGEHKGGVTKSLKYARLGGAANYETPWFSWLPYAERDKTSTLAKVAALRFERTHEPERHNLYNDWDKVKHTKENLANSAMRTHLSGSG
jgi:hypothetical protein